MDRRKFNLGMGAAAIYSMSAKSMTQANSERAAATGSGGKSMPEKNFHIGMIMFDNMTNLDFVGPHDILSRVLPVQTYSLAKSRDPVVTDIGALVLPEMALEEATPLDMLFVPGGSGSTEAMEDPQILNFLRERADQASWITSVCTGALVLGAAGLLEGYKAATHWTVMDLLPLLGADPVYERVVIDRNRITGGGVTAGIDFALTLIAHIWGKEEAQLVQLGNEYNPAPPFDSGSPDTAPSEIVEKFRSISAGLTGRRRDAAKRYAARRSDAY